MPEAFCDVTKSTDTSPRLLRAPCFISFQICGLNATTKHSILQEAVNLGINCEAATVKSRIETKRSEHGVGPLN